MIEGRSSPVCIRGIFSTAMASNFKCFPQKALKSIRTTEFVQLDTGNKGNNPLNE